MPSPRLPCFWPKPYSGGMPVPFRWDITRSERLGRLVDRPVSINYPELLDDLRDCCARVVATAAGCDLVFVGRSPESLFDLLSGLLLDTSWAQRLTLVNLSLRTGPAGLEPTQLRAVRDLLADMHLAPEAIAARPRDLAVVDLVSSGATLGNLAALLCDWAQESGLGEDAVRRRLRFVGVTWRTHTSPNTLRWQQQAAWTQKFRPSAIKNVSIEPRLWHLLGNAQDKVALSNPPWRWTDAAMFAPPQGDEHRDALRFALHLFELGRTDDERRAFVARLVRHRAMREPELRALVTELRGHSTRR